MNACPATGEELDLVISEPGDAVIEAVRSYEGGFAVLGAGGKMGFHLCLMLQRALQALGRKDQVLAVSRFGSVRSRAEFEQAGMQVLATDLSTEEGVSLVPKVPNVFFLAGVKFGTAQDPDLLHRMNVLMPQLVADHCRDARIAALSTGCVYSFTTPESGGSTEQSETNPPGDYANSCKGREQAFFQAAEEWGTQSVLIRLNYSIDLRYGVLVDLAQKVLAGQPIDLTTGYVNVIWQGDAIAQTIRSLALASAPPFLLNVTGPVVLRVRDLATSLGEKMGREVAFTGEESPTAWLNNSSKAQQLFGPPEVDLEQMLDWVADWIRRGGEVLGRPTHFEARDGNY